MIKRIPIFAAIVVLALLPVSARADVAEELAKLRAAFEEEIAETGEPQLQLYLTQLESLERALAEEGNYAGAIQTRDEAEAIKAEIARHQADSPDGSAPGVQNALSNQIILKPQAAATAGVVWDRDFDLLRGWRNPEDVARWQLPNLRPGGYEVVLEYLAGDSEGGTFVVAETFFRLTGEIESTGGETVKRNFGTLKIRSGQAFLSLFATRTQVGGLMRLKSIELVPAWR